MAYESRTIGRQRVRWDDANDDNLLQYQLMSKGDKITPTSATITVFAPGNTTAVLAATAMTLSGTLLTYALDTTTEATFPQGTGYRAEILTTVGAVTHPDAIIFDVTKYIPTGWIGRDQLLAIDDSLLAMDHAGDEDFSEVINSAKAELDLDLETRAIEDGQMLASMMIDKSRTALPHAFLTLAYIHRANGDLEKSEVYRGEYDTMIRKVLAGVKYDADQDLDEDRGDIKPSLVRLVY